VVVDAKLGVKKNGKKYGICGDGHTCICSSTPITDPGTRFLYSIVQKMDADVVLGVKNKAILVEFVEMDIHVYVHQRLKRKMKNMFGDNIN
jgi:hypothetical protein